MTWKRGRTKPLEATTKTVDLGLGYTAELRYIDGELHGLWVIGPAGKGCNFPSEGRCGGWVPTQGSAEHAWKLVSEDPIEVSPSVQCSCDNKAPGTGQHGFVRAGKWVNAGGIVAS